MAGLTDLETESNHLGEPEITSLKVSHGRQLCPGAVPALTKVTLYRN